MPILHGSCSLHYVAEVEVGMVEVVVEEYTPAEEEELV